jgi:DNA-binding NarL/FixJ family response regulator
MRAAPDQDPKLIAGFYEAAAEPARWPATWGALCDAFDARSGLLFRQYNGSDAPEVMATVKASPDGPRFYADHAMHLDPFARTGLADPGFARLLGQNVIAPRDLERSEIYADFSRRHVSGAFHFLCAKLPLEGTAIAGLGLHRPREAEAFAPADRAALAGLTSHLAAALRLERLLDEARLASQLRGAMLDQLQHGAAVTDGTGALLYANQAASRLSRHGGLRLPVTGMHLACENTTESATLSRLIAATAKGGPGGTVRVTRPGRRPYLAVTASALPLALADSLHGHDGATGLVLVSIRDLGATSDAGQAQLIELFGLTGAEAAIMPQMMAGETARQIAQSRGVAQATVRDQANRILAKTGAANLRALTAMISALGCG